jgi:[ribosomal protein S5]-alanine N-acetyltransferase
LNHKPIIETQRCILQLAEPAHAELILQYQLNNRIHLAPWEPVRAAEYFTLAYWQQQLTCQPSNELRFVALNSAQSEIIGLANFTNICGGAFQACHLGYSIAETHQGQGYMREILTATINYLFQQHKLHRIMANYLPSNQRSAALLTRLGFVQEGLAKSYLKIAGVWQDHVLSSKINEESE